MELQKTEFPRQIKNKTLLKVSDFLKERKHSRIEMKRIEIAYESCELPSCSICLSDLRHDLSKTICNHVYHT